MDKISILTPYRNASKYLKSTCESIINQSFPNWEWILVDDHSKEDEDEILRHYTMNYPIKRIKNKGKGIVDALVTALENAEGKYITRMDADDIMPKHKLELFYNFLHCSSADIVTGKVKYFSDQPISKGYEKYENWLNSIVEKNDFYGEIYRECTLASGNWMMERSVLQKCGGFNSLSYPEDYDLLFRWYKKDLKIAAVKDVTHLWREHPERTSRNHKHYSQTSFFHLKVHRFLDIDYNKHGTLVLNGVGPKAKLTAKVLLKNKIPFFWLSHEAEKYRAGIYQQKIIDIKMFQGQSCLQVLNAVLIDNNELKNYFLQSNKGVEVFFL